MDSIIGRARHKPTSWFLLFLALNSATIYADDLAPSSVSHAINQGNQSWILGMKTSDALVIAETYTEGALNCGPAGDCERGRDAIFASLKRRLARLGRAVSANVTSLGSSSQGGFVYEWGIATAEFASGRQIEGRYLTVWQKQEDGTWKIFRNLSMP